VKIFNEEHNSHWHEEQVLEEAKIMQELDHPNITKVFEVETNGTLTDEQGKKTEVMYISMQYEPNGCVFDYLWAGDDGFGEKYAKYFFLQLLDALSYCHSKGISHRDIKPDNLLFDEEFNLKVTDFGIASRTASNETQYRISEYKAPEISTGAKYNSYMIDIFAAAVNLFTMMTGRPPFCRAISSDSLFACIHKNRWDKFWKAHSKASKCEFNEDFKKLFSAVITSNPKHRASLSEILCQKWCESEEEVASK
jgi:serine/threonine protein kinase